MTADTPSILVVRDGSTPPNSRNVGGTADSSGTFYPEHGLRFDGNPVGAAAPLPVVDTVSGAALGTPADVAWGGTGSSSIVAALKALWVALTGTVKTQIQTGTNAIGTVGVTALPALPAGTNALGTVGVTALPAIPAGTNAIGSVAQTPTALSNSATGTVGTAAAIIVPFSASRKWLAVFNRTSGTEVHDLGSSNVVVGSGIPVAPGAGFVFNGVGAAGPVYAITSVSSSPFSYVEA